MFARIVALACLALGADAFFMGTPLRTSAGVSSSRSATTMKVPTDHPEIEVKARRETRVSVVDTEQHATRGRNLVCRGDNSRGRGCVEEDEFVSSSSVDRGGSDT